MKICHHAICKECVLRCFVCPKHECRSIIDEASFGVLFDQINSKKVTLDRIILHQSFNSTLYSNLFQIKD